MDCASVFRDGYIDSVTNGKRRGGMDQDVFRGDIVWTPADNLAPRFNHQNDTSPSTASPVVMDAMHRTFDDRTPCWVTPLIGTPGGVRPTEVLTFPRQALVEPMLRTGATSWRRYPGGCVGLWGDWLHGVGAEPSEDTKRTRG